VRPACVSEQNVRFTGQNAGIEKMVEIFKYQEL